MTQPNPLLLGTGHQLTFTSRIADGEAKFWLSPVVALANHTGLSERQLREAQTVVEAHVEELNDAWNQHFKT